MLPIDQFIQAVYHLHFFTTDKSFYKEKHGGKFTWEEAGEIFISLNCLLLNKREQTHTHTHTHTHTGVSATEMHEGLSGRFQRRCRFQVAKHLPQVTPPCPLPPYPHPSNLPLLLTSVVIIFQILLVKMFFIFIFLKKIC